MRKIIVISLAVFLAVATGGYVIAWFAQASQIKHSVADAIARVNTADSHLTYDAIETSGFPSELYVSIVRPHFTGRIDTLLKAATAGAPPAAPGSPSPAAFFESLPEWNEDVLIDGRIIIGINAFSDHYSLHSSGNWQHTSTLNGQTNSSVAQSNSNSMCTLQLKHSGGLLSSLWDFQALSRDGSDFFQYFRSLDCSNGEVTVTDATSKAILMTGGPSRFYATNTPQAADQRQVRVYLNSVSEVAPAGDALINTYMQALNPHYTYAGNLSAYGKQAIDVDFSYTGPAELTPGTKNPTLDIALSKFNITTAINSMGASFHLSNATQGPTRNAALSLRVEMTGNEKYDALVQEMVHNSIQQIYADHDPRFARIQPTLDKYTPDQMYAIIAPAIPNFSSLGKIVHAFDASFQGNPEMTAGDATLHSFELSATPYGITGTGTAKITAGQPIPAAQLSLACSNCLHMVDDIGAYAMRIQTIMQYFQPGAPLPLTQTLVDGVKNFLNALASPAANATTLNYALVSDGKSFTINSKSPGDVMGLYREYIIPVLPQPGQAH